jgi:hypothetical protein
MNKSATPLSQVVYACHLNQCSGCGNAWPRKQSFLDVVESAAVEQPDRADGRVRAISVGNRHEAAVEPVETASSCQST